MCLAIPGKIKMIDNDNMATVDIMGVSRSISVDLTPNAQLGDYVLVHAGFAIEVVDAEYAQETIDIIKDFPEMVSDELVAASSGVSADESSDTLPAVSSIASSTTLA